MPLCELHNEELLLFCQEDREFVCPSCTTSALHAKHSYISATQLLQQRKEHIAKCLEGLQERTKSIDDHQKDSEARKRIIVTFTERLCEELNNGYNEMEQLLSQDRTAALELAHAEMQQALQRIELQQLELLAQETGIIEAQQRWTSVEQRASHEDAEEMRKCIANLEQRPTFNGDKVHVDERRLQNMLVGVNNIQNQLKRLLPRPWAYASNLTLDPDTANVDLVLSSDLLTVSNRRSTASVSDCLFTSPTPTAVEDNPHRFDMAFNVLCKQRFSSGTHYFEVSVRNKEAWTVGVVSEGFKRKGTGLDTLIGKNPHSWALVATHGNLHAWHNNKAEQLKDCKRFERLGILLRYDDGQLSFYNADTNVALYTFNAAFSGSLAVALNTRGVVRGKNTQPLSLCPLRLEMARNDSGQGDDALSVGSGREHHRPRTLTNVIGDHFRAALSSPRSAPASPASTPDHSRASPTDPREMSFQLWLGKQAAMVNRAGPLSGSPCGVVSAAAGSGGGAAGWDPKRASCTSSSYSSWSSEVMEPPYEESSSDDAISIDSRVTTSTRASWSMSEILAAAAARETPSANGLQATRAQSSLDVRRSNEVGRGRGGEGGSPFRMKTLDKVRNALQPRLKSGNGQVVK
ncbi:E3 ubiquitin-protein ligase TRIM39-like [Lethenteron reissneri]|uniref:E3 ubiquitin-protein ligase TRIM39-like n=1 Tax=Lethenteron reissneri TaxID=7753 RepID=UPI002AB6C6BD|nr:E3 ubiquitin-protein ligase TRIM39-like [Lethenteron reissneri]